MTAYPFFTFPIRGKRDAMRARYRARQVARLLQFSAHEQACIAAGTFAVVCQALEVLGKSLLCFQIDDNKLHVFLRSTRSRDDHARGGVNRIASLAVGEESLLRLVKALPPDQALAEADLAWLVQNVEDPPAGLFDEVVRQNQEVLSLLYALTASQNAVKEGQAAHPSAA
jgi:hypothetical protein